VGDMPFTTPAADVYQATAAVTIPDHLPTCVIRNSHIPATSLANPPQKTRFAYGSNSYG
jgi:hypothetical protein